MSCAVHYSVFIMVLCVTYIKARRAVYWPCGILRCNQLCCYMKDCRYFKFSSDHLQCRLNVNEETVPSLKRNCVKKRRECDDACLKDEVCLRRHDKSYKCVDTNVRRRANNTPSWTTQPNVESKSRSLERMSTVDLPVSCRRIETFKYLDMKFNSSTAQGCAVRNDGKLLVQTVNDITHMSHPLVGAAVHGHFSQRSPEFFTIEINIEELRPGRSVYVVYLSFCPSINVDQNYNICVGFILRRVGRYVKFSTLNHSPIDTVTLAAIPMKREWHLGVLCRPETKHIILVDMDTRKTYAKKVNVNFHLDLKLVVKVDKSIPVLVRFYKTNPLDVDISNLFSSLKRQLCSYYY